MTPHPAPQLAAVCHLPLEGQPKQKNILYNGVNIPVTEEYCRENLEYYDALLGQSIDSIFQPSAAPTSADYVTRKEFEEDMKDIRDTLHDIKHYFYFFCVLAIIVLILCVIGLFMLIH